LIGRAASADDRGRRTIKDRNTRSLDEEHAELYSDPVTSMADLELETLGLLTLTMGDTVRMAETPSGMRVIVEFPAVDWEGDRVQARLHGAAAADWLTVGPEGTATLDMRFTLATVDGAFLYVSALGRTDSATFAKGGAVHLALFVETGDAKYAWLNRSLLVARGALADGRVKLSVANLR
jgi:hypothetical protein